MSATTVVVSPHFDDAVLSCWHLLDSDADVRVVNVFTGVPPNGVAPWWDRLTGATDSSERVRVRMVEDREALALAGRSAAGLGLLDEQYRAEPQALAPVVERIRAAAPEGAVLAVPAALARHTDHELARAAGLALRAEGFGLLIYADLPHAILYGWPTWVTGGRADPALDVGGHWQHTLSEAGIEPDELRAEVVELDAQRRARKLDALRRYRTQLPALDARARVTGEDSLRYEVLWHAQ